MQVLISIKWKIKLKVGWLKLFQRQRVLEILLNNGKILNLRDFTKRTLPTSDEF